MSSSACRHYRVWDLPVRLFHWINFVAVFALITVALIMMFKAELGITGTDAKVGLKELHVSIGYVFVVNLALRLLWGFFDSGYGRWRAILPGRGFIATLRGYVDARRAGREPLYLGHNPLGRLAVTAMLAVMLVLASSGLIRAATDVYYPPFGALASDFVAADGVDPASLKPYDKTGVDAERMAQLKEFKGPFGDIHAYAAYTLMALIVLHIGFVIRAEVVAGEGLVSAMFSGRKTVEREPVDGP